MSIIIVRNPRIFFFLFCLFLLFLIGNPRHSSSATTPACRLKTYSGVHETKQHGCTCSAAASFDHNSEYYTHHETIRIDSFCAIHWLWKNAYQPYLFRRTTISLKDIALKMASKFWLAFSWMLSLTHLSYPEIKAIMHMHMSVHRDRIC